MDLAFHAQIAAAIDTSTRPGWCTIRSGSSQTEGTEMSANNLTPDEIRTMAERIGLSRLTEAHLLQLRQVINAKQAQRAAQPEVLLMPADEPANVFNAADGSDSK
jgi:hypothetical protein